MAPIEGKIAQILDEYNVVINVGRGDGVCEGMPFVIFATSENEVKDPDTGKVLGKLETVKGYVSAVHVQDGLSICAIQPLAKGGAEGEAKTQTQTLSGAMMAESLGYRSGGEHRLNVNPSQVSGMALGGTISIGDGVRSIGKADSPGKD
ncbi:MAG: hypothetical protein J3T61_07445 [Candidatus Brocadiales bacterium]|nr:hypothetical protein [Candidatus Bathyanammoxibius sp.]